MPKIAMQSPKEVEDRVENSVCIRCVTCFSSSNSFILFFPFPMCGTTYATVASAKKIMACL